jgi:uncharacterized SAM-binding protein YcdF (DUF218 family)
MGDLSTAFLRQIGDYMLVKTPLKRADACIVFGGGRNSTLLAAHAAELHQQGYFDLAVVTGGVPIRGTDKLEAHEMRDVLLSHGMQHVLVEDKAQHTGENVLFSRQMLENRGVRSVIGVGQIYASRRFLMTLERQWPEVEKMFSAPNHFPVPPERWHEDDTFRAAVLREHKKVPEYLRQDLIREIDMDVIPVAAVATRGGMKV